MTVRINVRRLLGSVLTTLILPLLLAITIDMQLGWFPLITIGATVIFVPLSTVIVIRAALSEMDQVIQKLAPLTLKSDEAPSEEW